jgi:hypothetical protein
MLETSKILFDDEEVANDFYYVYKVPVSNVVIVHLAPTDMFVGKPVEATRYVIPAMEAIKTQLFVAERLGRPYASHKEALDDYIAVHWAWCEMKEHANTSKNPHDETDIIVKPKE